MPTTASSERFYFPGAIKERRTAAERFAALNRLVTKRGGWIVSMPSASPVTVEMLPGSFLLNELSEPNPFASEGFDITPLGEAERILPSAIEQRFTTFPDGTMQQVTADSTRPVSMVVRHAGVTKTYRYQFKFDFESQSDRY